MNILAGLFVESIDFRQIPGPSTRIDITGAFYSQPVPEFPAVLEPHLIILIAAPSDSSGQATLVTEFYLSEERIARNVQPVAIEAGKLGYRLVKPELHIPETGMVEVRCHIPESDSSLVLPLHIIPIPE